MYLIIENISGKSEEFKTFSEVKKELSRQDKSWFFGNGSKIEKNGEFIFDTDSFNTAIIMNEKTYLSVTLGEILELEND